MFHHVVSYRRSLALILCTILFLETQADSDICKKCTCNSLTTTINCAGRNLLSIPQPIPTNVEHLYLFKNKISTIKEGTFTGLSNLNTLYLQGNNISTIKEGAFTGLSNLNYLYLGYNNIATIKEGAFTGLSNLKELYLYENNIATIKEGTFTGLSNLKYLDLGGNNIATITEGAFTGLSNLKTLYLQGNNISTIKEGAFTGLSNLNVLYLFKNKISTIKEGTFTGLSNLQTLNLNGNNISTIKEGAFTGLSNLKGLDLRWNNISTIKEGAFTGLSNLKYLYLSDNKISRIEKEMFRVCQNLERLYLHNNPIETYEDGAFLFLPSIAIIDLPNNNLMKCGCHLPAFVKYIKKVYNRIVDVRGMCLEGSGKRIPILDYSQCQNYSLFQRNLQCQTCSGIICNEVTSCPGTEPVCRFAISMNGAKLKTERSCSTYRKCVEAMRNNTLTCNKRTNGTSCTGCCVGHLCNKNDFIGWTKSFVFRLIFKKFNEYKIPAENISRAIKHDLSTVTGTFRVEDCGSNRNKIFAIYCTVFSEMTESQLRRNISQVLNKSQELLNLGVKKSHIKFIDERNIDSILEEVLDVSQKSVYFKEDVELAVDLHEKMVPLVSKVSANITLNHTLRSINNLLNIREEVLAETEQENRSANRLLHLIQEIPEKIPLEEQQVTAIYSNLGIGVAKVNPDAFDGLFYGVSYGTNEPRRKTMIYDLPNPDQQEADAKIMASISLPRSLLKHLKDEERSSVSRITFFSMRDDKLYRVTQNSSAKGNTKINSHVLATSIPNISISNLDEPINISFNLINQNANKPQCVYWDESSGLDPHWSLNGCNVSNYIPGKEVTCSCDRLKSFAVLMDVYQKEGEKENANYLSIVSNAGFGISFVCLVFTIIIHVCFRNPWDLMSSKVLVSLCSSLAVTYFIFLVGMQTMAGCKVVAGFLHYFLLTSLAWMSVEAFHVFLSVVVVFKTWETSFMKKSSILAWGLPAVIVTITLAINNTDNYTKIAEVCWLSEPSFHVAFLTPVVIILIFNFILISLVTWRLISPQRNKRFDRKRIIVRVLGLVGLLFLFGLTWVFAFFAVSEAATVFRYLFLVCNTLQGIFIFVFYCLYKKDTRDGVKEFVIKRKRANPWKFTTGKSSRCGNETEYIAAETNF